MPIRAAAAAPPLRAVQGVRAVGVEAPDKRVLRRGRSGLCFLMKFDTASCARVCTDLTLMRPPLTISKILYIAMAK